jgi:hypothetical protein
MPDGFKNVVREFRPDIGNNTTIPEGKTVVTFRQDDPYNCHTFHKNDYIRNTWGMFFEICAIEPVFIDSQAMVVCRRTV